MMLSRPPTPAEVHTIDQGMTAGQAVIGRLVGHADRTRNLDPAAQFATLCHVIQNELGPDLDPHAMGALMATMAMEIAKLRQGAG